MFVKFFKNNSIFNNTVLLFQSNINILLNKATIWTNDSFGNITVERYNGTNPADSFLYQHLTVYTPITNVLVRTSSTKNYRRTCLIDDVLQPQYRPICQCTYIQ